MKSPSVQFRHLSLSNEWYTPRHYVMYAQRVLGEIDLDPASTPLANETVQAKRYYDSTTNGLDKPWPGKVWLNPPYGRRGKDRQSGNAELWVNHLIEQYESGITTEAILLVNAVTERRWFDPLWRYPLCFVSKRICFWNPLVRPARPTHGNVLIYFGENEARFVEVFDPEIGPVVKRISTPSSPSSQSLSTLWEVTAC